MINRLPVRLIPFFLVLIAIVIRIHEPRLLTEVRLKVFDTYQRINPRPYLESPVRIVDIDDESLARLGQWPWPRTQIAELIRRLFDAGAAVVAFDAVFAEPDRTSPEHVIPLWQSASPEDASAIAPVASALPSHDVFLADQIRTYPVVLGFATANKQNDQHPLLKSEFQYVGKNPMHFLPSFRGGGAVRNLAPLEEAAAGIGCISTLPDSDGTFRRIPAMVRLHDRIYPSLVAETLRVYSRAPGFLIRYTGDSGKRDIFQNAGIISLAIDDWKIPTDERGRIWLYDSGHVPGRFIPAWKLMLENWEGILKGKLIYVGTSAEGLKDLRVTPLNPAGAGVEIHAQLTEQILQGKFLSRPAWTGAAEFAYMLLLFFFLLWVMKNRGVMWGALLGILGVLGGFHLAWQAFTQYRILIDPLLPSVSCLAIYLIMSLIHYLRNEAEKNRIRTAFGRYISPVMVSRLVKHPELLKLGGETKDLSLLFSDIRGFATLSEHFSAQELTAFMNRFMTPMTEIILSINGTIDKYIGDSIMAFWNAPLDDPNHARHACDAALAMRSHLVGWNQSLHQECAAQNRPFMPVHIGIGINTGPCCVGNLGSEQRFDYSVMGDAVNVASRLEGLTKTFGTDIIIGEHTAQSVGDYAVLELDLIRVKGKHIPERIYALIGGSEVKNSKLFRDLVLQNQAMLAAYRSRDFETALRLVEECRGLDTPQFRLQQFYLLYAARIGKFFAEPPPPDWDGITDALTK